MKRYHWILIILSVLGALIRFWNIDFRSIWLDEATSVEVASHSLSEILSGRLFDNHTPPFYYCLLHFWIVLFPSASQGSEFCVRSLSAVIDTFNILLCFWAFRPILGGLSSLLLSLLYSGSAFALLFAQEARMYPLLVGFCLLFQGVCLRLPSLSGLSRYNATLALGIITTLGMYTHYYFVAFAASFGGISLIAHRKDRATLLAYSLAALVALLCFIPWMRTVVSLAGSGGQSFRSFSLLAPANVFFRFLAGYGNLPIEFQLKQNALAVVKSQWLLIVSYCGVGLFLFVSGVKRGVHSLGKEFPFLFVPAVILPFVLFLLSFFIPMFSERYLSIIFPHFLAFIALGLDPFPDTDRPRERPGPVAKLIRTTFWGLFLFAILQHNQNPNFGFADWRQTAQLLMDEIPTNSKPRIFQPHSYQVFLHPGYQRGPLNYYLHDRIPLLELPETQDALNRYLEFLRGVGKPIHIYLVEQATTETRSKWFVGAGLKQLHSTLYPFENGIRITRFSEHLETSEIHSKTSPR